ELLPRVGCGLTCLGVALSPARKHAQLGVCGAGVRGPGRAGGLRGGTECVSPRLQVRYGSKWSDYVGGSLGDLEEIVLHPGESIVQVSGKYKLYLRRLVLTTDKGRSFTFGKDTGTSFNAAPLHPRTVLRYLSGRAGGLIDALGFHWDTYPLHCLRCSLAGPGLSS
uniref:Zymogen granule protein 16 n=1 Tax=Chelonoidis abingdonii TaxID=106734 RepID=A0A8C0ISU0_CHEAB